MIGRLLKGLVIGLLVGGGVGAGLYFGLGLVMMHGLAAYAMAAATGVLVGLVAGKPIWSQDGKIEAGLKAVVGALVAAGVLFALRHWGDFALPIWIPAAGGGSNQLRLATSPLPAIPLIATVLALFFEIDNTSSPEGAAKGARVRVAESSSRANVADDDFEDEGASKAAKRKR